MKRFAIVACLGYALILALCIFLFEVELNTNKQVSLGITLGSLLLLPTILLVLGSSKILVRGSANDDVSYSIFILIRTAFSFLVVYGTFGLLISINYKISIVITAIIIFMLVLSLTLMSGPGLNKRSRNPRR